MGGQIEEGRRKAGEPEELGGKYLTEILCRRALLIKAPRAG